MEYRQRLATILEEAKLERKKGDCRLYEVYKRKIDEVAYSYKEYQEAIKELCRILNV